MQIYHNLQEWMLVRKNLPSHLSIGFVPTMGNLHMGHSSLLATSSRENDITVASVFVNRTQFNQKDDYNKYPRTLDNDLEQLEKNNIDYCIIPNEQEIYADDFRYQIHETKRSEILEGEFRPGHFTGVLTVVMKLFNLVKPDRCYVGEKDYQQYLLIRDMAKAFFMDIEIISCETIREPGGLALSSRNSRLNQDAHGLADKFASILRDKSSCEEIVTKLDALNIKVEYVKDYNNRRLAAVIIDDVRLIDNVPI
jgi:pantoate--beta-alanine ligase